LPWASYRGGGPQTVNQTNLELVIINSVPLPYKRKETALTDIFLIKAV
jgi:hypothetical protein